MSKAIIHTDAAPAAVGPYSQAVSASRPGKLVFLSGQIGLEPGTGELVSENFEGQVRQSFRQYAGRHRGGRRHARAISSS